MRYYEESNIGIDGSRMLRDQVFDKLESTMEQRRLTSVMYNDSVAAAGIRQPLTCIVQGNSVLFAFTTNSWVVIVRDSTLNTWQAQQTSILMGNLQL